MDVDGQRIHAERMVYYAVCKPKGYVSSSYDPAGSPGSELYFTAGPNNGTGGLFGYLKPPATDLTEGNDQ